MVGKVKEDVFREEFPFPLGVQEHSASQGINLLFKREDSMGRSVPPKERSVSWVNSVLRQFWSHGL